MSLQLPVYLFAAQTLRPDLVWESASYTPVDRVSRGNERLFLDQHWSASLTTLRQILTVLVNGIRSGHFFPTPDTCSPCPFPSICGTRIGQRIARKQSDPRVARFCHMRAIP